MTSMKIKILAIIMVLLVGISAYMIHERRGSSTSSTVPPSKLKPLQSLREAVQSVSSLKYTMSLVNSTYSDSYQVSYKYAGASGSIASLEIHVSKPPMNITIRINKDNGTVYRVVVDNGTGVVEYNGSRAPYIGFNVLKDALMPLVNPSLMSQIVDWTTMSSLDKNFELRVLGSREIMVSGRKYAAYMLLLKQSPASTNPIPGFVNMTYIVLNWKGVPVVYEMKVHRSDGVVTMHLDSFEPSK